MGFFSWNTQDTDRSICNTYSNRKPFTVYMFDNKGNKWKESDYEGYGEFGGLDFYELLATMNGRKPDRGEGIDLWFGDEPFISPNLAEDPNWKWENRPPKDCEYQGYFYDETMDEIFNQALE